MTRETTRENLISSGGKPTEGPRNIKQVYNAKQRLEKEQQHDDIFEMYLFAKQHQNIIVKFDLVPDMIVVQLHPEMTKHVQSLTRNHSPIVLHYDTTFDVGPFFTSVLSLRHPLFKNEPVVPVAIMFHEVASQSSHELFFQIICEYMLPEAFSGVIVTDREKGITNAIGLHLPNARNIFCWNHLRRVRYDTSLVSVVAKQKCETCNQ